VCWSNLWPANNRSERFTKRPQQAVGLNSGVTVIAYLSIKSPYGDVTLFEENDALVALEWGRSPGGQKTPLLLEAQKQLGAYFDGNLSRFDLPLAAQGTPFYKRVWAHMLKISYGQVETYGEVATKIGSAHRAVGCACGSNPIPIIVPCHRIVGAGGRLTGYTGADGIETKKALLQLEGVHLNPLFSKAA
jgi:methylated-DNA-[protein]-cysteine S-methyltransferase